MSLPTTVELLLTACVRSPVAEMIVFHMGHFFLLGDLSFFLVIVSRIYWYWYCQILPACVKGTGRILWSHGQEDTATQMRTTLTGKQGKQVKNMLIAQIVEYDAANSQHQAIQQDFREEIVWLETQMPLRRSSFWSIKQKLYICDNFRYRIYII